MNSFLEVLENHLEAKNKEPDTRSTKCFHPSEMPFCIRAVYYSYTGAKAVRTIKPSLRLIFDHGHKIHELIQDYLSEVYGKRFQREVPVDHPVHPICGNSDGVVSLRSQVKFGIEIKSINERGFKALKEPKEDHVFQANIYAGCLDLPFTQMIYYNKNDTKSKGDESALPQLKCFRTDFDKGMWSVMESKILHVKQCAQGGEPPEREITSNCHSCKFVGICKPNLEGVKQYGY